MDKKELIINKYYKIRKPQSKTCKSKSYNYYVLLNDNDATGVRISITDVYDNVKRELLEEGLKSIAMTTLTRLIPDRTDDIPIVERPDIIEIPQIEEQPAPKKERKERSDKGKHRIQAPNLLKLKCI